MSCEVAFWLLSLNWFKNEEAAGPVFPLQPVAGFPVAGDLGLAFDAGAGRIIVVVDDVEVLLAAIVPPHPGVVDLAVNLHRDLLVALAHRGRLKIGNALLEIGAAIAAEIGRLGRFRTEDRRSHTNRAAIAIRLAVSLNPPVMTPPILLLNDAC